MSRQKPVAPQGMPTMQAPQGMPAFPGNGMPQFPGMQQPQPMQPQFQGMQQPQGIPGMIASPVQSSLPMQPQFLQPQSMPMGMPQQTQPQQLPMQGQSSDVPLELPTQTVQATISDELFDQYLAYSKQLVQQSPTARQITVHHGILTRELAATFVQRNFRNRYLDKGLGNQYKSQMLTCLKDANGEDIQGTTEWDWTLPIYILMDNGQVVGTAYRGNVHNGQHCIYAWVEAINALFENAAKIAAGKSAEVKEDYAAKGITPELLQLQFVLVRGINPDAADFVDINRPRTTGDVVYRDRENLFGGMDYTSAKKKGKEVVEKEDLDRIQNAESKDVSTVAKIVAYRKWYGDFVRGGSIGGKKFNAAHVSTALSEFPGIPESVHYVTMRLKEADPRFRDGASKQKLDGTTGTKGINVSIPYLMASHYLAKMAWAKSESVLNPLSGLPAVDNKGNPQVRWIVTPEGIAHANQFLENLVCGVPPTADLSGRWKWLNDLRQTLMIDPHNPLNEGRTKFVRDNPGLKVIFGALGHAFMNYLNPAYVPPIASVTSLAHSGNPYYGSGQGFDPDRNPKQQISAQGIPQQLSPK